MVSRRRRRPVSVHDRIVQQVQALTAGGGGGAQGPPGPQGEQGIQGPQGEQGIQGPAGTGLSLVKLAADEASKTDATLTNTGLTFAVTSGVYYSFWFVGAWQSTSATVGLKIGVTVPAVTIFTALARIGGQAGDGVGSEWQGVINTSGDAVICTASAAQNVNLPWVVEGVVLPSASGSLTVQYAAETTGATVTLKRGSIGMLTTYA